MKIAVATTDGTDFSQHFGRSTGFVVFGVDGEAVNSRELRTNDRTPHAQGFCDHSGGKHESPSHTGIAGLLQDCQVVLCGGMGAGAAEALNSLR